MNTIEVLDEVKETSLEGLSSVELVDPVVERVVITLYEEDVSVPTLELWTDFQHWDGVGIEIDPSGPIWEDEVSLTEEKTVVGVPTGETIRLGERQVVFNSFQVEFESIASISLFD